MKLIRFVHQEKIDFGVLEGETIRGITGDIFSEWETTAARFSFNEVRLVAPVCPPNIIAIGMNYRRHAEELNFKIPAAPVLFLKATSSLVGPDEPVILPKSAPDEVDYEAELVVVIGRKAKGVSREDATNYILGYTCGNDVSARDCQFRLDQQWARGKSFDTFAPLGPVIETELDPGDCRITSRLNGQVMQDSSTKDLIFDIPALVSYCSQNITLLPGTVIMTGTPEGVGYKRQPPVFLKAGDTIEVEIEGIGVLRNPVIKEK
jgi:2-keto-4-pentenoate hydratase/2-oxohepta-3-ene-1,7-dioic acid hydratase in catechol pathway